MKSTMKAAFLSLSICCSCAVKDEESASDSSDHDEDGLSYDEELELGTDPESADTDSDGYTDGEEVHAGTDPLDPESVIYIGGWPYNMDKESLEDPGWSSKAAAEA